MEDLAHALRCTWRSLADIQEIALAGKFGNTAGQLKPLEDLRVKQLHQELEARGYATGDQRKPRLQAELTSILSGVQRVPTLLALDPSQSLASLNEVLDCEPLISRDTCITCYQKFHTYYHLNIRKSAKSFWTQLFPSRR